MHDRVDKQRRHLDFFQFEAWLHAKVGAQGQVHLVRQDDAG